MGSWVGGTLNSGWEEAMRGGVWGFSMWRLWKGVIGGSAAVSFAVICAAHAWRNWEVPIPSQRQ